MPLAGATAGEVPSLPPFSLDVQALDLGSAVKAVGLELLETESREPVGGRDAVALWSAALPALAQQDHWVMDFFSHTDRVREFCAANGIAFREATSRCLVLSQPDSATLEKLLTRFADETFGVRAGAAALQADAALESELSQRGMDAYERAYERYLFCAICELGEGWVTLLSATLWASEIIRRVRPALRTFDVHIARPQ